MLLEILTFTITLQNVDHIFDNICSGLDDDNDEFSRHYHDDHHQFLSVNRQNLKCNDDDDDNGFVVAFTIKCKLSSSLQG
ncbi:hypothetical protein DERP_000782 [Dermatophagoides pteronyssinus]|uniref:Uncharacterized protein n=1 Tax=Dermatophagoides pteronyssinus TaxID=6956 RepID=A0ABQ8J143_DERPT|nr:hypothetical protein DERP_000782 [Dermatophagoides pteronyssinus]